jgi:hypothetical protein
MTGGIEEVVRAYEGEDAARHVREVLEENAREKASDEGQGGAERPQQTGEDLPE